MEELCVDECERLFYGGSSSPRSSSSAHFSSLFHVSDDTPHNILHQPTVPSLLFEEWMAEEAGMTESSLSRICGDLFENNLQLQLNRSDLQVSETEAEGTRLPQNECSFHTETDYRNDLPPPSTSNLSLESPTLSAINAMNILNDIDPQTVASSTSSSNNANLPDLKKIIVKKTILDKAVERLGGGKHGAERLWGLIQLWLKHPNHNSTSLKLPLLSNSTTAAPAGASLEEIAIQEFDASVGNASPVLTTQTTSPTAPIIKAGQPVALGLSAAAHPPACKSVLKLTRSPTWASRVRFIGSTATTRAARKHKMAGRRRRRGHLSYHQAPSLPYCPLALHTPATTICHNSYQESHFPFHERKVLKLERNLRLFLCKELKQSDVGSLDRIVLPKGRSRALVMNHQCTRHVAGSGQITRAACTC